MFDWDDASLTQVCYVVIREIFVQDEKIDRTVDGKCPKTREIRLYRYRSIIHNNLCRRDTWIDLRLFGYAHRCVVVYVLLKYDPTSLGSICATFSSHYTLSNSREPFITDADAHSEERRQNVLISKCQFRAQALRAISPPYPNIQVSIFSCSSHWVPAWIHWRFMKPLPLIPGSPFKVRPVSTKGTLGSKVSGHKLYICEGQKCP